MTKRTKQGDKRIAVAYLRCSTSEQALGPEAQRASIEAWARAAGVTVVEYFTDAISGGSDIGDRPGLAAALAAIRVNGAGVLVAAKRDRLARDTMIAAMIDRAVESSGATVVAADGAGNGDAPAERFMRSILDAAAEYERSMIRARTRAALKVKRDRGERTGNIPFGYALAADGVALVPHEGERAVLVEVRKLRAAGLSLRAVVDALAAAGIGGRTGKPFALRQVALMAASEVA